MWSLGEVTSRILTNRPTFQMYDLLKYTEGTIPFPKQRLHEISEAAILFINSLMLPKPNMRRTAEQALQHEWLRGHSYNNAKAPPVFSLA